MSKPIPPFVRYVCEEILPQIWDFTLRNMMSAYILHCDGVTFSLLTTNDWYLRVIPETENWYLEHDCERFSYTTKTGRVGYMPFCKLPIAYIDDIPLLTWLINESIVAARIAKQEK